MWLPSALPSPIPKKQTNKKIHPEKNSLYFRKWNFLALPLLLLLLFFFLIFFCWYFLKRKLFLYFRSWNPALFSMGSKNKFSLRKFLTLQETETLKKVMFQEKGTPQKLLYFRKWNFIIFLEVTFRAWEMKKPSLKKLIIFLQVKLFNHKLEILYILGRNTKDPKNKQNLHWKRFLTLMMLLSFLQQ